MIKTKKRWDGIKTPKRKPKGRQENYFFPNERKTIRASSMKEAIKKLKE